MSFLAKKSFSFLPIFSIYLYIQERILLKYCIFACLSFTAKVFGNFLVIVTFFKNFANI